MQNWSVRERFLQRAFVSQVRKHAAPMRRCNHDCNFSPSTKQGLNWAPPFKHFRTMMYGFMRGPSPVYRIDHWVNNAKNERAFFFYTCVCLIVLEIPRRDVTYTLYRLIYTGTYTLLGRDTGTYVAIVHVRYVLTFNTICVRIYIFK